jgi:hypothetical protein
LILIDVQNAAEASRSFDAPTELNASVNESSSIINESLEQTTHPGAGVGLWDGPASMPAAILSNRLLGYGTLKHSSQQSTNQQRFRLLKKELCGSVFPFDA